MSALVYPTLAGLAMKVQARPIYSNVVHESESGKEFRHLRQSYPRYLFQVQYDFLRTAVAYAELQKLRGFFARHGGRYDSFLLTVPDDNAVTDHAFGVGNASATVFQLQRTMVQAGDLAAPGSRSYWPSISDGYEPITALNGAPSIYLGGVLKATPADYSIGATGLVTWVLAPGAGVVMTWTGSYYWRCRFEDDDLTAEQMFSQIWKTGAIGLRSVK